MALGGRQWRTTIAALLLLVLLGSCGGGKGDDDGDGELAIDPDIVRVASFEFTESRILAELYAQALEAADVQVRRAGALASREILEPALEQDVVDLVPEYTGSALEFLNRGAGRADADAESNHRLVRDAFATRQLEVLAMAPAQNQNAVAVTAATASRLALTKVSDLAPFAADLVFGGPPECAERPFCLVGLQSLYGLRFKELRALDAAGPATIGALEGGEIDVALLFTTNTAITANGWVLLEDDKQLQVADNVVPVLSQELVDAYGATLTDTLEAISAKLTTADLTALNAEADGGKEAADVAGAYLEANGLG